MSVLGYTAKSANSQVALTDFQTFIVWGNYYLDSRTIWFETLNSSFSLIHSRRVFLSCTDCTAVGNQGSTGPVAHSSNILR